MLRWLELRWQERESQGCGIQVPAPKQSGEQGVLCLWAVSHLCFCLPGCGPGAFQTNVTEKETWTGLSFLLCIIFGLAIGTLLYMPIICLLLWQCRRNRKGKLTSRQVAEGNQLSTASPVTGTKDLTYANLKFEKKGTNPTSSDVVYTEIKALQQKQGSGDAGAANAGVDVSPEGEGK
ncbi:uncharacterized protein M6G45_009179 [Spheniscus humboldti]